MLKHHSRFLAAIAVASLLTGAATALSPIDDRTTKTFDPETGKTIVVTEPELDRAGGGWTFGTSTTEPLTLFYQVTDIGGGLFDYEFRLKLTNQDAGGQGSWAPGQGWRWLIFGDQQSQDSNLLNFVGDRDDLPIGPWNNYTSSGGFHNGPTLSPVLDYWVPTKVGETLRWSGTSTADLPDGELLWSTIAGTQNGAIPATFTPASRREPPPKCDAPCDMDCSGTVDAFDIEPFLQILFEGAEPCDTCTGDANGDGVVDAFDIEPFLGCLFP